MFIKIFSLTILFCSLLFSSAFANCPTFLDADRNYILYADLGSHGAGLYVDRHTCSIVDQSDSQIIILIDDVQVPDAANGSTRIANRFCHRFKFDLLKNKAFSYEPYYDSWAELDPYITNIEDDNFSYDVSIAEIAFFIATGQKFFGALDISRFDDNFYLILI